jgi:hypothetical protein
MAWVDVMGVGAQTDGVSPAAVHGRVRIAIVVAESVSA